MYYNAISNVMSLRIPTSIYRISLHSVLNIFTEQPLICVGFLVDKNVNAVMPQIH